MAEGPTASKGRPARSRVPGSQYRLKFARGLRGEQQEREKAALRHGKDGHCGGNPPGRGEYVRRDCSFSKWGPILAIFIYGTNSGPT